jgi:hypothetical protein
MSDYRERAWVELVAAAERYLEHPKDLPPRESIGCYGSLLRLWHFPDYGPQRTWTILAPGKKAPAGASPMVREVTWDRDGDSDRLFTVPLETMSGALEARPTIRLRDAFLPADELQERLAAAADLAVPLVIFSQKVGLDGEYFGLETYETSPFVRVQWWGPGPAEWRHWIDWATELRAFLGRVLSARG